MADYTVHKGLLTTEFCDRVAETFKDNSTYAPRGGWKAYDVNKGPLYTEILENFFPAIPYKFTENWINITEYQKGDSLRNHRDTDSSLTLVSEIKSASSGGRFIINNNTYIKLNKGDVITFNGSNTLHGVETVFSGRRLSLNMWTYPIASKII